MMMERYPRSDFDPLSFERRLKLRQLKDHQHYSGLNLLERNSSKVWSRRIVQMDLVPEHVRLIREGRKERKRREREVRLRFKSSRIERIA